MQGSSLTCWVVGTFLAVAALLTPLSCQQLTADEKVNALAFLNHLRRSTVPRAADMNGLLWDANLETLAQKAANSCVFLHNYGGDYASLGETLYFGGNRNMIHILMFMFLERENYDYKTGQCNSSVKYQMFKTCGHYLQLATANINTVGCAVQQCNGSYLAACEFDRMFTSPPYQTGEPGTKCGNSLATFYQNGLCYAIQINQPTPIPGPFECRLICLNNGFLFSSWPYCTCICSTGFSGVRCENRDVHSSTSCPAQAVTCRNGGTPTMVGSVCKCACPANFRGDNCEVNIAQSDASVFLSFGGDFIYQSYYPVNITLWSSTVLRSKVQESVTQQLNIYCAVNWATCCPNSNQSGSSFVTSDNFYDTDNYPTQDIDGSMVAGVNYKLSVAMATACTGSTTAYVSRGVLFEAVILAKSVIDPAAADLGLVMACVK